MINLYNKNWLVARNEKEVRQRSIFVDYIVNELRDGLSYINNWFTFHQCECSQLTPKELINEWYTKDDVFVISDELTLRPETTMGSYEYARHILNPHSKPKVKMPVVVRQHWKSFRNEQDKTQSNMRLKEFYQLEFQIIYWITTENDYHTIMVSIIEEILWKLLIVRSVPSDRLPEYSEKTTDIEVVNNSMEICSISQRKDFYTLDQRWNKEYHKVVEIAIGTDRLIYNFNNISN